MYDLFNQPKDFPQFDFDSLISRFPQKKDTAIYLYQWFEDVQKLINEFSAHFNSEGNREKRHQWQIQFIYEYTQTRYPRLTKYWKESSGLDDPEWKQLAVAATLEDREKAYSYSNLDCFLRHSHLRLIPPVENFSPLYRLFEKVSIEDYMKD